MDASSAFAALVEELFSAGVAAPVAIPARAAHEEIPETAVAPGTTRIPRKTEPPKKEELPSPPAFAVVIPQLIIPESLRLRVQPSQSEPGQNAPPQTPPVEQQPAATMLPNPALQLKIRQQPVDSKTPEAKAAGPPGAPALHPSSEPLNREAPARDVPVREAPVHEAPGRDTLSRDAMDHEAPVHEAPVREAPVREAPGRDILSREALNRDALSNNEAPLKRKPLPEPIPQIAPASPAIATAAIHIPPQPNPHTQTAAVKQEAPFAESPARLESEIPEPPKSSAPVRSVSIDFTPDGAQDIRLRLSERAGDVHISLHSSDASLSGRLHNGVGELVQSLTTAGYDAQRWTPDEGSEQQRQRRFHESSKPTDRRRRSDPNGFADYAITEQDQSAGR